MLCLATLPKTDAVRRTAAPAKKKDQPDPKPAQDFFQSQPQFPPQQPQIRILTRKRDDPTKPAQANKTTVTTTTKSAEDRQREYEARRAAIFGTSHENTKQERSTPTSNNTYQQPLGPDSRPAFSSRR
eukprot:c5463_g1_i3.p2 GENE.c5463_g1_i3~~c5463_g1_i3.p2  ORF type:complete len:128 (+),score=21.53 c5463_g1_i3:106-489(+)